MAVWARLAAMYGVFRAVAYKFTAEFVPYLTSVPNGEVTNQSPWATYWLGASCKNTAGA